MRRVLKRQRTILGRLLRDIERKIVAAAEPHQATLKMWLARAWRICRQRPKDKGKLYALHAPEVECISKSKARQPYEFGVKASLAITEKSGLIVGARTFPGNPYDGHTLAGQLEQTRILLESVPGDPKPTTVLTDLGYRGVDIEIAPAKLIHRSKYKTLSARQRKWLKRRQAVEPVIGHVKADHGLRRCWLKGSTGDALHAVLCAAGFNLRWLLRAIARMGIKPVWLQSLLVIVAAVLHTIVSRKPGARESRPISFSIADVMFCSPTRFRIPSGNNSHAILHIRLSILEHESQKIFKKADREKEADCDRSLPFNTTRGPFPRSLRPWTLQI